MIWIWMLVTIVMLWLSGKRIMMLQLFLSAISLHDLSVKRLVPYFSCL